MSSATVDEWDPKRAWPDRAIAAVAARQRTMIAHGQLIELGVRPRTIGTAVQRGRLYRVHVGVYSLVPAGARPALAAERAALLACGETAAVSHHSAAKIHGFRVAGRSDVHVTVVGDRRRPGLTVHRTRAWHRHDVMTIGGLRVTTVARTLVDLGAHLPDRPLEHLLDEALKRTSRSRIGEALDRHPGRRGCARLRRLLDPERPSSDTWSAAEERLLRLIRRAGLPMPEVNVPIGDFVPDLLWRKERVIVEFDSYAHHSGPAAFQRDRARRNALSLQGYTILHVTRRDLTEHPERVLVEIGVALARGGAAQAR